MKDVDLKPLFAGVDDDDLLHALDGRIRRRRNNSQATFQLVWWATSMVNGSGIALLFEQDTPLNEYAEAFVSVGIPEVKPLFDRVNALIPAELQSSEEGNELIDTMFDELNKLTDDFFEVTKDLTAVLCRYVRAHRVDFAEYIVDEEDSKE